MSTISQLLISYMNNNNTFWFTGIDSSSTSSYKFRFVDDVVYIRHFTTMPQNSRKFLTFGVRWSHFSLGFSFSFCFNTINIFFYFNFLTHDRSHTQTHTGHKLSFTIFFFYVCFFFSICLWFLWFKEMNGKRRKTDTIINVFLKCK